MTSLENVDAPACAACAALSRDFVVDELAGRLVAQVQVALPLLLGRSVLLPPVGVDVLLPVRIALLLRLRVALLLPVAPAPQEHLLEVRLLRVGGDDAQDEDRDEHDADDGGRQLQPPREDELEADEDEDDADAVLEEVEHLDE